MQRIPTIVQKITDLVKQEDKNTVIDIDLMLDYTRVLYADLLEWRSKLAFTESFAIATTPVTTPVDTPDQRPYVTDEPVKQAEQQIETSAPVSQPYIPPVSNATDQYISAPQRDIKQSIGINDKYQFISELFGNNKEAYEEAIEQINTCITLQQALMWLDEHAYKQYYWSEDGEAVQSFYGILTSFFSER